MLDIKLIINNVDNIVEKIKLRVPKFNLVKIIHLYNLCKKSKKKIEFLKHKHKLLTKYIYTNKLLCKNLIYFQKIKFIKRYTMKYKFFYKKHYIELYSLLSYIPNIISWDIPIGSQDKNNEIISEYGQIKKNVFSVIDHITFGRKIGELDFHDVSILSGPRYYVMRHRIAALYRAIIQCVLNIYIYKYNYTEIYVPYIVKKNALFNTGQLPKFLNDFFYVYNKNDNLLDNFALIPTSEVAIVNLFRDKIISRKILPLKLVASTPCFRAEAGSYGKNNRGLIRTHQFDKIELIQIVHPTLSTLSLLHLVQDVEKVLQLFHLPYRKVLLCTGTMPFSSSKTYDIEVWSPVDNNYVEVASCSNTTDFQARRLNICYKDVCMYKKNYLHILNGTGLAIGRLLALIIESHQIDQGVLKIPDILVNYMNGLKYIRCK